MIAAIKSVKMEGSLYHILLFALCHQVVCGHPLFQNFEELPDFIAEKSDGETRTTLVHYGRVSGIHQTTTHKVADFGTENKRHDISIVTNGLVLAKTDYDINGIANIEKCYISADKQTVDEFLYIFDENFRGVDVEGITFLMEIPGSEVSVADVVGSDYTNSNSHSESDSSHSESDSSHRENVMDNGRASGSNHAGPTETTNTVWDEWNLRHGIDNQIPQYLQRIFDQLLYITDHCMSSESNWKHVHSDFILPGVAPRSGVSAGTSVGTESNRVRRDAGIYPGTMWCGLGDVASSYDDIGTHNSTDLCCREHDFCPDYIPPFSYGRRHFNFKPYTINHCDCDLKLRQCFQNVNTTVSSSVAYLFFNVFKPGCFTLQNYETCTSKSWWGRCYEYGTVQKAIVRDNLPWSHD